MGGFPGRGRRVFASHVNLEPSESRVHAALRRMSVNGVSVVTFESETLSCRVAHGLHVPHMVTRRHPLHRITVKNGRTITSPFCIASLCSSL